MEDHVWKAVGLVAFVSLAAVYCDLNFGQAPFAKIVLFEVAAGAVGILFGAIADSRRSQ